MAELLGFAHRLRTEDNLTGEFTENEIYHHVTNCQVFLAYNVDETKLLKRRMAFQKSMKFLFDLAEDGNVKEANRFSPTRAVKSWFVGKDKLADPSNKMRELGIKIAQSILKSEGDTGKAAATLLLIALDGAYNSVLAVSLSPLHFRAKRALRLPVS